MIRIEGIPVIDTPRLRLRGPLPEDYEGFARFMASDRARYVGGPVGRTISWRGFCHLTGHWVHRGYSNFVLADRETDRALGLAGPWFPEGWPEPEIGWSLWDPDAEGTGIAYEGATAARAYAYTVLGWKTAISLIVEGNDRSVALATRMGAVYEADFTHEVFGKSRIFRHPGPEALA